MLGHPPSQLFRYLVAQRFTPLGVVGSHIYVDESPAIVVCDLAAKPVDFVVSTLYGYQRGPVNGRPDDFAPLQVPRNKYYGAFAGTGRVCGNTTGEVAGGGASQRVKAELDRLSRSYGNYPVFKREGGIDTVVFNVEVAQPQAFTQVPGFQQWRIPGHDVHRVFTAGWQQVLIPPDAQRARGDALVADYLRNGCVIVDHFQRPETEVTNVQGFDRIIPAAFPAL